MSASREVPASQAAPVLHVTTPDGRVFRFIDTFHVGREPDCDLRLDDPKVSRKHLEVAFHDGRWEVRDLKSANGVFVDGRRITTVTVEGPLMLLLGVDGPSLLFELNPQGQAAGSVLPAAATVQSPRSEAHLLASYEQRYFGGGDDDGEVGGRTLMIRKAFENVQRKQHRRFAWTLGLVALLAVGAAGYAYKKHVQVEEQRAAAQIFFYEMKAQDVEIANIEQLVARSGNAQGLEQVQRLRSTRLAKERSYDEYLKKLNLYDHNLSEEDRLILRVTRRFGECELTAMPEYVRQVKAYIRRWQSTNRYTQSVSRANQNGYTTAIANEFLQQNLPPEFFYLAMQESSFDPLASGPPTRMGYAKGMWQFIPSTGAEYGLRVGPLAAVPRPDPGDDRHDWKKSTTAAARYIKNLYATDAQASGLLVIASYNWGEGRVLRLLKTMPNNPQERNFWKLVERYHDKLPNETYDYVFNIVSAAVIGENPRLFGIQVDNPLGFVDKQ